MILRLQLLCSLLKMWEKSPDLLLSYPLLDFDVPLNREAVIVFEANWTHVVWLKNNLSICSNIDDFFYDRMFAQQVPSPTNTILPLMHFALCKFIFADKLSPLENSVIKVLCFQDQNFYSIEFSAIFLMPEASFKRVCPSVRLCISMSVCHTSFRNL